MMSAFQQLCVWLLLVAGTPSADPITTFFQPTNPGSRDFQLSHHQQAQILSDVQRHQPIIYSHQLFNRHPFVLSPTPLFQAEPQTSDPQELEEQPTLRPSAVEIELQHSITDPEQIKLQLQEAERLERERALEFARIQEENAKRIAEENAKRIAEEKKKAAEDAKPKEKPKLRVVDVLPEEQLFLQKERQKLFDQLKQTHAQEIQDKENLQLEQSQSVKQRVAGNQITRTGNEQENGKQVQQQLQKQFQSQLQHRQELLRKLKQAIRDGDEVDASTPTQYLQTTTPRYEIFTTPRQEFSSVVRYETTTTKRPLKDSSVSAQKPTNPPQIILDQLTKGVFPPGGEFEVIRQKQDGELEEVQKIPQGKKVTLVFLEEQPDGTVKIQSVKGNGNDDSPDGPVPDVNTLIQKIQEGEVKLPPSVRLSPSETTAKPTSTTKKQLFLPTVSLLSTSRHPSPPDPSPSPSVSVYPYQSTESGLHTLFTHSSKSRVPVISSHSTESPVPAFFSQATNSRVPIISSQSTESLVHTISLPSPTESPAPGFFEPTESRIPIFSPRPTESRIPILLSQSTESKVVNSTPRPTRVVAESNSAHNNAPTSGGGSSLLKTLKREGLYAMAKYLRESGLDNILNDTGPYTVFAPTDKAFRALLVQLGGPERADEKFRENPRLLSGLLLHHVIPGAFHLDTLQDEMTGVSLAGTQLRVNTYTTQDVEWNEIKTVTINGAKISRDKHDIPIPQGVAHPIDRVMFPLPVGTILQTLTSDREGRFSTFLQIIKAAGLSEFFTGNKVHTVFAPTDQAFTILLPEETQRLVTDEATARAFVLRHVTTGTAYTAGMRFYQIRDSLDREHPLSINKVAGQIKVNGMTVVSPNIPATNGVVHALDGLL